MGRIVVLGSANAEIVVNQSRFPENGEVLIADAMSFGPGGKGSNQATAAARAGGDVCFVSKVGGDMLSNTVVEHMRDEGISLQHIFVSARENTGCTMVLCDEDGPRGALVFEGAGALLTRDEVRLAEPQIAEADVLLLTLECGQEPACEAVRLAKEYGTTVLLDPCTAHRVMPLPEDLLSEVDVLIPNRREAQRLTGIQIDSVEAANRAAKELISRGAKRVVLTMGDQGALYCDDQRRMLIPPAQLPQGGVVDKSGVGDAFSGNLAVALSEGMDAETAVKFASSAAAIAITRKGAADSMPMREELSPVLWESYFIGIE